MGVTERLRPLAAWLWPLAVANLLANIGIVVTGAAVRLTGSGLGCPTWPRCTEDSYVTHPSMGIHGVIEFGNRLLTFVLVAVAVACFLAAWAARDRTAVRRSVLIGLGIPLQALIGGVTVLTDLNPWVVSLHFMASMLIIMVCLSLLDHMRSPARADSPAPVRLTAHATLALGWVVLYLGTVVTGAGPHAGDADAERNGLDPALVSMVHAGAVAGLLLATSALLVLAVRRRDRWLTVVTCALLGLELAQGAVGWAQYVLDLPVLLVALHMLGAGLIAAGLARVTLAVRAHEPADPTQGPLLAWAAGSGATSPRTAGPQPSSGSSATATNSSER